jgi:hypothetical protein
VKVYEKAKHRFFDDLVTILSSHVFFSIAINQNASAIDTSYSIGMGGNAIKTDIEFFPYDLMKELAADGWPNKIVLEERLHTSGMPAKVGLTLVSGGILMLTAVATQGAFIRYFEDLAACRSSKSRY